MSDPKISDGAEIVDCVFSDPLRDALAENERLRDEIDRLRERIAELEAKTEPIGPREPDNDRVICPHCCSQFRAIPVNVQARIALADAEIKAWREYDEIPYYDREHSNEAADSYRKVTRARAAYDAAVKGE